MDRRSGRSIGSDPSIESGDRRVDAFLRGLVSGALVGAVIAGSTIWERRRRASAAASPTTPVPTSSEADALVARDEGISDRPSERASTGS
jgi:hypothetical protein